MPDFEIKILGEIEDSKFGLKKDGKRQELLQVSIEEATVDTLSINRGLFGLTDDDRLKRVIDEVKSGALKYFIARDFPKGDITGYTSVTIPEDCRLYVEVFPEYKGRKIGPQLIKDLQGRFNRLTLDNLIGPDGHAFYQDLGFRDEGMPGHMVWEKPEVK